MYGAETHISTPLNELAEKRKGDHSPSNHLFKYYDTCEITSQNVLLTQQPHGLLSRWLRSKHAAHPTLQDG